MIISVREVRDAKELLKECRAELLAEGTAVGDVEVGIMVKTPAAVMMADELSLSPTAVLPLCRKICGLDLSKEVSAGGC